MGSRKQSRPNLKVEVKPEVIDREDEAASATPSNPHYSSHNTIGPTCTVAKGHKDLESDAISFNQSQRSRSWYAGGTWPRMQKSTPSLKVARETILADKTSSPVLADFSRFEQKKSNVALSSSSSLRPPFMSLGKGKETLDMTLPATQSPVENKPTEQTHDIQISAVQESSKLSTQQDGLTNDETKAQFTTSGWLDWLGMVREEKSKDTIERSGAEHAPNSELPVESSSMNVTEGDLRVANSNQQDVRNPPSGASWFGFWPAFSQGKLIDERKPVEYGSQVDQTHENTAEVPPPQEVTSPAPGSTWAFWSKESRNSGQIGTMTNEVGVLAIKGEFSQDKPIPAHASAPIETTNIQATKQRKRERPQSVLEETTQSGASSRIPSVARVIPITNDDLKLKLPQTNTESQKATSSQSPAPSKPLQPNILLPSFRGTYRLMENPSIIQQFARLITHGRKSPPEHVHLLREPPVLKKALAIGIHGLFPAALLRTVIGQPTGTSIRFANHAAAAIHRWAETHGYRNGAVEVEKIALEGEGKIAERVDNLWKLLLNWIDLLRAADFILVACHSQGVPVAIILVAKLIEFGVVTSSRVGICAMAGVSLGPFADYKSRLFSGSAAELFDFANPDSEVSKRYDDCLRLALNYGARITYVGSIDDQLVSLESAIFGSAYHPYIYRAVFVDGRVHAPDFIANLVGFALKLRNLGVSDHGLIRELSAPLAGSLYTGEGHSRLYDEVAIYDIAIQFALETSSVGKVPVRLQKYTVSTNSNPFQLPWSMRGLLEEDIIKTELYHETKDLLHQFEEWKPSTKAMKDVKYRLEAIRSKL